jgi:hypothetical protein
MTTRCLIGVDVDFPREADTAMAVIAEEEIEPTTKMTGIAINNKRHPFEIIFFQFSWNYIKQASHGNISNKHLEVYRIVPGQIEGINKA